MAPGVIFCFILLATTLSNPVTSCVPQSIQARVPVQVNPGYVVSQVPLDHCGMGRLRLTSSDPDYSLRTDGTIVTVKVTTVTETGKSFRVWVRDREGHRWRMDVHLIPDPVEEHMQARQRVPFQLPAHKAPGDVARKRSKRRWSPLPFSIIENELPPFPRDIELVGSDSSANYSVYYIIEGPGVTLPPENLFSVDRYTGMVRVHYAVDREQYPKFVFSARVFDKKTGKETDRPLDITVLVEDVNDNAPTFSGPLEFHVAEQSSPGTEVGMVSATDRDQADTPHAQIRFSLLTASELFVIDAVRGMISTNTGTLDREAQLSVPVTVEVRDMNGAKNGLFNTATATVILVDINDNPPTFSEASYKATIEENQAELLVLRIPVDDKDEEKTKNWNALFVITQGNENGNFRIDTDPLTNEGRLYVIKPLDYEKGKMVTVVVSAQNEAPLVGASGSWHSVPVELSVGDVDEGPEFSTPNMVIQVKENRPIGFSLGTYTAFDPETKSSKGIKYYSVSDPGSWVSVDENTGELKTADTIDLESPLVSDAMYHIIIKAVDPSGKSGNGTVTLVIDDLNDNVPVIPEGTMVLCEVEDGERGFVTLQAEDPDLSPYSGPFHFSLPDGHDGKWRLRDIKNKSAVLEQAVDMPRGLYSVPVRVSDLQDNGGVRVVEVRVCRCLGDHCVAQRSSVALGVWALLAMLLALALLLLLCIFCVFACTTKGDKIHYIDDCSGGMLLTSNTEAPGEEVKSSDLLIVPSGGVAVDAGDASVKGAGLVEQLDVNLSAGLPLIGQHIQSQESLYQTSRREFLTAQGQSSSFYTSGQYGGSTFTDAGLLYKQTQLAVHTWNTNGLYLEKKLEYFGGDCEERYADDLLRAYGYEGEGSPAGSVGCCSDLGDLDNLDFLDSLGSKFKTLAHICMEKEGEGAE